MKGRKPQPWLGIDFAFFGKHQKKTEWVVEWFDDPHSPSAGRHRTFAVPKAHTARRLAKLGNKEGWSARIVAPALWRWPSWRVRLPIAGETESDVVRKELWDDERFGQWVFHGMGYPWFTVHKDGVLRLKGERGVLFDLIDHIEDPYGVSPSEAFRDVFLALEQDGETDLVRCPECFPKHSVGDSNDLDNWDEDLSERCQHRAWALLLLNEYNERLASYLPRTIEKFIDLQLRLQKKTNGGHRCHVELDPLNPPEMPGVYCIQGIGNFVKIGKAKNIRNRIREIQLAHPVPLKLLAVLSDDPSDEGLFHKTMAAFRAHGEWFRMTAEMRSLIISARTKVS